MSSHHSEPVLDRRGFVRLTASTGLLGAAGLSMLTSCSDHTMTGMDHAPMGGAKPGGTPTRNPLRIPPTVNVGPSELTLTAAPGSADLGGGRISTALEYNGEFPGPTIRASSGDRATISLVNGLSEETITHWHGMLVDDVNDGHPRFAIGPGGTYRYAFTVNQRAALNWYHPHPHMLTGKQVALGLAGAFIVNDAEEASLGL
ncbi:MAG: multicopper oxidase domain-containing protein, partial [Gemmatimonadota bacterium]|nr:multicopper oxidase domain-containing protein [Gemmatimonadota bacterium]